MTIVSDDNGQILADQFANRLGSQILVGEDFGRLDAPAQNRSESADGGEMNGVVFFQGFDDVRTTIPFSDHPAKTGGEEFWRISIHSRACGRSGGPDRSTRTRRGRSDEVNDLVLQIDGERFVLIEQFAQPFMGCIASGKQAAC